MKTLRKGTLAVMLLAAAVGVVLSLAFVALKKPLLRHYYLRNLKSSDEKKVDEAARALLEMGPEAIPAILQAFENECRWALESSRQWGRM